MHLVINGIEVEAAECVLHFRPEPSEDAAALKARLELLGDTLNEATPPASYELDIRHDQGSVLRASMKVKDSPSTLCFNIVRETDSPPAIQALWD
jgi:hypothetical protein